MATQRATKTRTTKAAPAGKPTTKATSAGMPTAKKKTSAGKPTAKIAKKTPATAPSATSPISKSEAKVALARESRTIAGLRKDLGANAWQIGRRLLQVEQLGLAVPAGFVSTVDYAEKTHGIARSTAFSYMRVADAYTEATTRAFGVEKLERGLAYIARTPEDESPRDLLTLKVRVPDAAGEIHERAFAEVTVNDLRAAAVHENALHGKTVKKRVDPNLSPHLAALARANRALDAAVEKSNAARAEVLLYAVDGLVLLDVRGVPLARAAAALTAIKRVLA